jgi:hypothetical protein
MKSNNLKTQDRREGSGLRSAMRILRRISRFFTDRYSYREQPGLFPDLAAFAVLTVAAIVWPIASLATVLARLR